MEVKQVKYADTPKGFRLGYALENPKPKAHFGVLIFLPKHNAATFFVNSGQVHLRQTGTEDLCMGFAHGAAYGMGYSEGVWVKSLNMQAPQTRTELEELYAKAFAQDLPKWLV